MSLNIGSGITIEGGISIVVDYGTPINAVPPVISTSTPNIRVGKTVTTTTGTWNSSYPTLGYYYQWLDNNSNISGATSNTYVVQSSDLGNYITANVIAYSSYGNSAPATSNALGPVLSPISQPTIGDYIYGGYYAGNYTGYVNAVYNTYYVIVADISTGSAGQYNSAYLACQNLVSGGYNDWELPIHDLYPIMQAGRLSGTWPTSQNYNVSNTALRNYWVNQGYPHNSPSELLEVYIFATGSFDFNYYNNFFSYRATRFEPIVT
jgi:hypothetical protein